MMFGGIQLTGFDINYEVGVVFYETLRYWQGSGFWFWVSASGHWYQISTTCRLDEKRERDTSTVSHSVHDCCTPLERWRHGKIGGRRGGGRGWEWESKGESRQSVVGEGYIITHDSQPVGVCECLLPGAGCTWNALPVNSQILWEGRGVMQRMLLSPCLLLLSHPPLLLQLIKPQHFPFVSARNQIPPPAIIDILNSWTLQKPCAILFHCHVNYWSDHAQLLMPVRGSQNDSWSQELIN